METILNQTILEQVKQLEDAGQYDAAMDALKCYVDQGMENGSFSRLQARQDLSLALRVAEIDLKMDEYEAYCQAFQWLQRLEDSAQDSGIWFYRYAKTCMYTSRLEQALELAQQAAILLPQDPLTWELLAKLRAHFGQTQLALQAVEHSLQLSPEHARLLRLRQQIEQGQDLEQMELPPCESWQEQQAQTKQAWGECPAKSKSILCILQDDFNLEQVKQALQPISWLYEEPCCFFTIPYNGAYLDGRFDMNEAGVSKFSADWIRALLNHLPQMDDTAKGIVRLENKGFRLELEHLVIQRTGSVKLGYHVGHSREERLFAYLTFDFEFAPQQHITYEDYSEELLPAEPEELPAIPTYPPDELGIVEQHIQAVFGTIGQRLPAAEPALSVELAVIEPTPQKNYYTVVTIGMGAYQMQVPPELQPYHVDRAEMVMYLPPNWKLKQPSERWQWPLQWMRHLAQLPMQQQSWLGWGHTVPKGYPFAVDTDLSASMFIRPQSVDAEQAVCRLPGGDEVNFYQVLPLYNEELVYKQQHGADLLVELLHQRGVFDQIALNVQRNNTCGETAYYSPLQIELLEQLEEWHQQEEYQKIVDAVNQLNPNEQSYRMMGLQARALNNLQQYQQAVDLLQTIKQQGQSDPLWHFRLGYAYYHMGQEQQALQAFLLSEELAPGNENTQLFIHWCRSAIALPVSVHPFQQRVAEYWADFVQQEQQLRQWMEQQQTEQAQNEHRRLLQIAFSDVAFSVSYQNGCHRLTLLGQSSVSRLLQYAYWQNNAPETLWSHWEFVVGSGPAQTNRLMIQDVPLELEQIQVWTQQQDNGRLGVELYAQPLSQLRQTDRDKTMAVSQELMKQVLGEVGFLACMAWVDVLEQPKPKPQCTLDELLQLFADTFAQGDREALQDPEFLLENYQGYRYNPTQNDDWILRQDVIVGSSCCNALVRAYYQDNDEWMNLHQQDGVICGFLFYANDGLTQQQVTDLRGTLEDELEQNTADCAVILGGATGFKYSYIDCMCFDLKNFLNYASERLNQYPLEEIGFHVFRVDCGGVNLKNEPEE